MQLQRGQVAVITGAASGIGRAIAAAFATEGLDLVLSDVDARALAEAATELAATGVATLEAVADVRDAEAVEGVAAAALERFGRFDVVVNNAGVSAGYGPLWEVPADELRWILEVDLFGVLHGIRAFVPHLVQRGSGHVVNISSLAGVAVIPFNGPYNTAKQGVIAASETLRAELAQLAPGVGVTVVCPGRVATRIGDAARSRPHADPAAPTHLPSAPPDDSAIIIPAEDAAAIVVAGIRNDHFLIGTHQGVIDNGRARYAALRDEIVLPA